MNTKDIIEKRMGTKVSTVMNNCSLQDFGDRNTYECRVVVLPLPEGGFSARALRLENVAFYGNTIEEAVSGIAEPFRKIVMKSRESHVDIPWVESRKITERDAVEKWILVSMQDQNRDEIVSRIPSASDLDTLTIEPPPEWLDEPNWD